MTVSTEPQDNLEQAGAAAHCGLAALLMGGILTLVAMLMLHINLHIYHNPRAWWPNDIPPLRYAVGGGGIAVVGLTGASLAWGIRGVLLANRRRQSSALAWAGVLICSFAGLLWIVTLVNFFAVTEMLLRLPSLPTVLP